MKRCYNKVLHLLLFNYERVLIMKKISLLLMFSLLVIVFLTGCEREKIVGEWIGTSSADAIVFNSDGTFAILYYACDQTEGGYVEGFGYSMPQDISGTGKWREGDSGTYTVDLTKDPGWIDLILLSQGTSRRVQGLINFKSDDVLYLQLDDYGTGRPATINEREAVRLSRAAPGEIKR